MKNEYDDRRSDPQLRYFVDCLREAIGKDPLYDRRYRPDIERFNIAPAQLPAAPSRSSVY